MANSIDSFVGIALLILFLFYLLAFIVESFRAKRAGEKLNDNLSLISTAFFSLELLQDILYLLLSLWLYERYCFEPRHLFAKQLLYSAILVILHIHSAGFIVIKQRRKCVAALYLTLLVADILAIFVFNVGLFGYILLLSGIHIIIVMGSVTAVTVMVQKRLEAVVATLQKGNAVAACLYIGVILFLSFVLFFLMAMDEQKRWYLLFILFPLIVQIMHLVYWNINQSSREGNRQKNNGVKNYKLHNERELFSNLIGDVLTDEFVIMQRLITYFEHSKPYLDKALKLEEVSRQLYTNKTYLSKTLNHKMSKNFNQFVNRYRIKEACTLFIEEPNITISELYDRAGFTNISSFSAAFSLNTGYTPAEWCKEIKRRLANGEHISVEEYLIQKPGLYNQQN